MIDLELVDTKSLLSDLDIEYSDRGKNTTHGWINISCPFCGDASNHCGINLKTNLFSCWACQEKGNVLKLIHEIKGLSYRKIEALLNKYTLDNISYSPDKKDQAEGILGDQESKSLIYPRYLLTEMPEIHRKYLVSRNFDPDFLTRKYKLKFTYNTGDYRFKIVAPIFIDYKAVSWIAADVIRDGGIPYLKCQLEKSVLSANDCLYNIDSVKKVAVLVEGITDVWRIGDGCVASMTKSINSSQIQQLIDKDVKKVFVMYDSDALDKTKKMAAKLSGLFLTEVIELSEGDPADLTDSEVTKLREDLFKGE